MYLVLLIVFCLLLLSYIIFDRDVFSPSVLTLSGYCIAAIAGIYNQLFWDIDISSYLIIIMVIGWSGFILGEFFVRKVLYQGKLAKSSSFALKEIKVDKTVFFLIVFVNFIIILLLWKEIYTTSGFASSFSDVISGFKNNDESLSSLMTQLVKFIKGSAYVFLFITLNNFFYAYQEKKKFLRNGFFI